MSIDELVEGAGTLLELVAPEQERQRVAERPDVRTIRYYTSQGLLPKPVSYDGGRARYDDEHLLRLLLIKKLQADYMTLRQIRSELADATRQDVLNLLTDREPEPKTASPKTVSAQASATSRSPQFPGFAMRRYKLGEGSVDIPESALDDAGKRTDVAARLRELADALEAMDTE